MVKSERGKKDARSGGIGAADRVVQIVRLLCEQPQGLRLTQIASALGWDAGLTHRYLRTLVAGGLLQREGDRSIVLGPLLLTARESVQRRPDQETRSFEQALHRFHAQAAETIVLNRWTPRGPQAVWVEDSPDSVSLTVRLGSVLPLLSTASGHVALAFAPAEQTRPLVSVELAEMRARPGRRRPLNRFDVADLQDTVSRRGLARARNFLYEVAGMAVPLRTAQGGFWGCLTVLGPQSRFDDSWRGPMARGLRAFSAAHTVPAEFTSRLPVFAPVAFRGEGRPRAGRR
jgi:DNA-binding IclR family transcriptional regulator